MFHIHRFKNTGRQVTLMVLKGKKFAEQKCRCGRLRLVELPNVKVTKTQKGNA